MDCATNDGEAGENEWELSKENVLPLRQGRKFSNLSERLSTSVQSASTVKETRQSFEEELRTYNGDDPLDVWERYVKWTEQNFPKGGKDSNLRQILERCVAEFKDDTRYTNDPRYLSTWLKYAETVTDKLVVYKFLYTSGIGSDLAVFYDTWATNLEAVGNHKKAEKIYTLGINKRAQPLEILKKQHSEFLVRVAHLISDGTEGVGAAGGIPDEDDEELRSTLGGLKAQGKHAPVTRVGHAKQVPKGGIVKANPLQTSNTNSQSHGIQVYSDENEAAATIPQNREYAGMPSHRDHSENVNKPGAWNKTKLKQKGVIKNVSQPLVPMSAAFSVHEDSDLPQPMITPRKITSVEQVLSAKKPEKDSELYQALRRPSAASSTGAGKPEAARNELPMYCKTKVYAGVQEFQFEEIRAVRWKSKLLTKQEEEAREEERKQQMEQLLSSQRQHLQHEMEQRMGVLQQQFQAQLQQQEQRIASLMINTKQEPTSTNNKLDRSANQSHSFSSSMNPTPSTANVTMPKSILTNSILKSGSSTPASDVSSSGAASNVSLNRTASSGSSKRTPYMSVSLQSTSYSGGGISAPSPTVNTREALQAVMGMFNHSTSANTFGIETSIVEIPEGDDLEEKYGQKGGGSGAFMVYEEMDTVTSGHGGRGAALPGAAFTSSSQPFVLHDENAPIKSTPVNKPLFEIFNDKESHNFQQLTRPNFQTNDENQPHEPEAKSGGGFVIYDESGETAMPSASGFGLLGDPGKQLQQHQPRAALGQKRHLPVGHPVEAAEEGNDIHMAEHTQVLACYKSEFDGCQGDAMETGVGGFDPSEVTFAPGFSSTRNFTDMARLASTPFNPSGEMAPLSAPPVSSIKLGMNMPLGGNEMSGDLRDHADVSHATQDEGTKEESSSKTRRSSMFGGQSAMANLSPIMEQSDEDAQMSVASNATNATHHNVTSQCNKTSGAQNISAAPCRPILKASLQQNPAASAHSYSSQNDAAPQYSLSLSPHTHESSSAVIHSTYSLRITDPNHHSNNDVRQKSPVETNVHSLSSSILNHTAVRSISIPSGILPTTTRPDSPPPVPSSEGIGDMTCHHIDINNYRPPDDFPTENLNMSVAIDPNDPFDEDLIKRFLKRLPKPIEELPNYHKINAPMPQFTLNGKVTLGSETYMVKKKLGEGGFAKVYLCELCTADAENSMDLDVDERVVKVQKPACPWEFYICTELHERLTALNDPYDVTPCVMNVDDGYFFNNGSCLFNEQHRNGTLLAMVNVYRKQDKQVPMFLIVYITIELLRLMEHIHKCNIIHGDVKPDNFLVRDLPRIVQGKTISSLLEGEGSRMLKLIDFGRSIDMHMFPKGTTFTASVETSGFQCIQMMTGQPWTYQTDHFGLAGTIYVMLAREYMKVKQRRGDTEWDIADGIKRYWAPNNLWRRLFRDLLNINCCDQQPDLPTLRAMFESYLVNEADVTPEMFNKAMAELEIMLYKAA